MKPRQIIIYLIIFILAGGFYWVYDVVLKGRETSLEEGQSLIFNIEKEKINEVSLKTKDGEIHLVRQGEKDWKIVRPVETPAVAWIVNLIVDNAQSAKKERAFADSGENPAQFGLENPALSLTFMSSGKAVAPTLHLGDQNPVSLSYYARLGQDKEVFTISEELARTINKTLLELRNKDLLLLDQTRIDGLRLKGVEEIELKKAGDWKWDIIRPGPGTADPNKVDTIILDGLKGEIKEFFPRPENDSEFGIDNPVLIIEVLSQGKVAAEIKIGGLKGQGAAGAKETAARDLESYYAVSSERPEALLIDADTFNFLNKSLDEIVDKHVLTLNQELVSRVEVKGFNRVFKADKIKDEWKIVEPAAARTKPFEIGSFLMNIKMLEYSESLNLSERALVWYGLDKPALEIRLNGSNEAMAVLKFAFVPQKENQLALQVETGPQGGTKKQYLIDAGFLAKLPADVTQNAGE